MVKLSIIILNYNSLDLLKRCLSHLEALNLAFTHEIVVVDNGSTDDSASWLGSLNDTTYQIIYSEKNLGFAGGNNLGIKQARGQYIVLLNTDAFPKPKSLDQLIAYLDDHAEVGIVGPQLLYADGRWQISGEALISPSRAMLNAFGLVAIENLALAFLWKISQGRWIPAQSMGYIRGACMMFRRVMTEALGPLDESYFFTVEDVEFCDRMARNGWKVKCVPQSQVIHLLGGSSTKKNPELSARMLVDAQYKYVTSKYGPKGWQKFRAWSIFTWRFRYLCCRLVSPGASRCMAYRLAWQVYRSFE